MKKHLLSLLLLLGLLVPRAVLEAQPAAPAPPTVLNGDFEAGAPGEVPLGWAVTEGAVGRGYKGFTVEEKPAAGRRAAVLEAGANLSPYEAQGALRQVLDATPFRGKRVRFAGVTRVEGGGPEGFASTAYYRIGIERPGGGRADGLSDPVSTAEWSKAQALAEVPADATQIRLDLSFSGLGKAYFDNASFAVVALAGEGNEPARALSPRGLDDLTAFTRLLGYVRFFHPSDPAAAAAAADWARVARTGMARAEKAADAKELARVLEEVFRPYAPTLRVVAGKERPALPPELSTQGTANEITAWDHQGVQISPRPNLYRSRRVTRPLEETAKKEGESAAAGPVFPKPSEPLFADLGGGVSALVPLALYKDAAGTLPKAAAPPLPSEPESFLPSGNDRTTRLADVALAWNVFQHFYPYFDVIDADWPAELRKALTAAATDKDEAAFLTTLRRLVAALDDGHGGVTHASETISHSLPLFWKEVSGQLVVTRLAPESVPGVALGDVVLRIDDRPAAEALAESHALMSAATPGWSSWKAALNLLLGPAGSKVKLELEHVGGERSIVTLERSIGAYDLLPRRVPETVAEIRPGIFYVDLDRISEADFQGAVERLATAKGVVFDLRGYPSDISPIVLSHLTDKTITCARWLVPRVTFPDRKDMAFDFSNWPVEPLKPRIQGKVAFLIDGRAISYAETYMGIVEAYHLAEIVGSPTAGTNGNINPFTLPGGYSLSWTGMKVLKHDGSQHHGLGIRPTVPVEPTREGIAAGRDEVLEKGIEVVGG